MSERGGSWISTGQIRRLVAGGAFGLYMVQLLYYLNPQISTTKLRLLLVSLLYVLIGAIVFGAIFWLLERIRRRVVGASEESGSGFGWIVFATSWACVVYLRHLETLRIFLPRDSARMLSNATRVIGAAAFLLFVLWLLERSRKVSGYVFAAGCGVIVLSVVFLFERRDVYLGEQRAPVVVNVGSLPGERRLIIVTIRSLPFDWLVTLEGEMTLPWLEGAKRRGFTGRLQAFPTTNPRTIWASLATGKLPYQHGVTGQHTYETPINEPGEPFLLLPRGVGFGQWGLIRPVRKSTAHLPSGTSLPFWSVFERVGFDSVVVNWPESAGADSPVGALVSDERIGILASSSERRSVAEVPALSALDPESSRILLPQFARDEAALAMAIDLLQKRSPATLVLSLNGLGNALDQLGTTDNELPSPASTPGVATRAYIERIDRMLARIDAERSDATLVVVSPSGPDPELIPRNLRQYLLTRFDSAGSGKDDGFVLLVGNEIDPGGTSSDAAVIDVVPTLLFATRLPVGRDMDGRVITEAFTESFVRESSFTLIQSYEAKSLVVRSPEER